MTQDRESAVFLDRGLMATWPGGSRLHRGELGTVQRPQQKQ